MPPAERPNAVPSSLASENTATGSTSDYNLFGRSGENFLARVHRTRLAQIDQASSRPHDSLDLLQLESRNFRTLRQTARLRERASNNFARRQEVEQRSAAMDASQQSNLRTHVLPSQLWLHEHRLRRQRGEEDTQGSVQDAVDQLQEATGSLASALDEPLPSFMPHDQPDHEVDAYRRRNKRRKLDQDPLNTGYAFHYGYKGQVVPGRLRMSISEEDGGYTKDAQGGFPTMSYKPENVLRNDQSVYCTMKDKCNLLLEHVDLKPFTLTELVIKTPEKGFTAPLQEGMIFIAMDKEDLLRRTSGYEIIRDCPLLRTHHSLVPPISRAQMMSDNLGSQESLLQYARRTDYTGRPGPGRLSTYGDPRYTPLANELRPPSRRSANPDIPSIFARPFRGTSTFAPSTVISPPPPTAPLAPSMGFGRPPARDSQLPSYAFPFNPPQDSWSLQSPPNYSPLPNTNHPIFLHNHPSATTAGNHPQINNPPQSLNPSSLLTPNFAVTASSTSSTFTADSEDESTPDVLLDRQRRLTGNRINPHIYESSSDEDEGSENDPDDEEDGQEDSYEYVDADQWAASHVWAGGSRTPPRNRASAIMGLSRDEIFRHAPMRSTRIPMEATSTTIGGRDGLDGSRRRGPKRIEWVDPPENNGSGSGREKTEPLQPHAKFCIEKRKHFVSLKFEPAVSGRYILIKMWSPHLPGGENIDVQSILAYGYGGTRFFPSLQTM